MENELILPTELNCGYYDSRTFFTSKTSPKRISATFEIEYFLEDGKNTYSDGETFAIRKNFVKICMPGEVRYSDLPYKTKFVKFSAVGKLANLLTSAPKYFHVSKSFEANELLDEIITLSTTTDSDSLLLYGKILTYVSLLLENANRSKLTDTYKSEIIVKAQEFIKERYFEPIKLIDIAKEVNLSPNYFHTLFTETYGITPRDYLENYRLSVAKKLLLTTQLTLSDIAEKCGFNNQQYLTTVFKLRVECSPTEFRRKHQSTYLI